MKHSLNTSTTNNNFNLLYQLTCYKTNQNTPHLRLTKQCNSISQLKTPSTPITTIGTKSIRMQIPYSPSIRLCSKPTKIKMNVQPLKQVEAPIHSFNLDDLISDFITETDSKKIDNILLGFIDNVSFNVNYVEFAILIRNQIQALRITIERLEQQVVEVTSLMNSMQLLRSKQFQMILSLKRI
ncbi:Hypothetical_protein [Hexamita inflata]|uniref:Hypothetical_protein n=1 Tax=Hexamita inflata TaxID=28002 RepID=A0AA86UHA7_9EUKA|nr:Hypothetical protein HINF_LOCUS43424 [Hexamita inflata]